MDRLIVKPMPALDTTVPRVVRATLRRVFLSAITDCETFVSREDQNLYFESIENWARDNRINTQIDVAAAGTADLIA